MRTMIDLIQAGGCMQRKTSSPHSEGTPQINDLELQQAYDALDVENKLAQTSSTYLNKLSGDQFTVLQGDLVSLKKNLSEMRARILVIHLQNKKSNGKSQQDIYQKEYKKLDAQDQAFFISESVFKNMKMLNSTIEKSLTDTDQAIAKVLELSAELSERIKKKAEEREQKARESESEVKQKHRHRSRRRHRDKSGDEKSEAEEERSKEKPIKNKSKSTSWLSHDLLKFAVGDYNARAFFPCGKSKKIKEATDTLLDDALSIKSKYDFFEEFQADSAADTKEQQLVETIHRLVTYQNQVLENDDHWLTQNQIEQIVAEYTKERGAFFSCSSKTEDNLVSYLKSDVLLNYKWIAIDYFLDIKGSNKLKEIIQRAREGSHLENDEKLQLA